MHTNTTYLKKLTGATWREDRHGLVAAVPSEHDLAREFHAALAEFENEGIISVRESTTPEGVSKHSRDAAYVRVDILDQERFTAAMDMIISACKAMVDFPAPAAKITATDALVAGPVAASAGKVK